jgi:enterochelin esterase-like enzyme
MRVYIIVIFLVGFIASCAASRFEELTYAHVQIPGKTTVMEYGVYTPPQWQIGERLPLIVFLHGIGGSHQSFEEYGAHTYLDEMINAGKIARAIIVMPNGDNGMWENWRDGSYQYRDWVLNYVVPQVQSDYQTLSCPKHCHLAGISMGGFGVLRFAYFARDQFSSVSAISAPIFSDGKSSMQKGSLLVRLIVPFGRIFGDSTDNEYKSSNPYNSWIDDVDQRRLRLQLVWGDQDKDIIIESNQKFHQRLVKNGIQHDYYIYRGGHKWKSWLPNFARVFNFLLADEERISEE